MLVLLIPILLSNFPFSNLLVQSVLGAYKTLKLRVDNKLKGFGLVNVWQIHETYWILDKIYIEKITLIKKKWFNKKIKLFRYPKVSNLRNLTFKVTLYSFKAKTWLRFCKNAEKIPKILF